MPSQKTMQGKVPCNCTLHNVVGYGFRPTDEELVGHYLKHKLQGDGPRVHVMPEIDLCDVEPWEIPVMLEDSMISFNDPEWFFFSRVDYKYVNSKRFNRKTKYGYWKITGKQRDVKNTDTNAVIGTKKTLVFHEGRVPNGVSCNWVIHEYHDATFDESQRNFVLCRLIKKPEKTDEGGTDALICDEGEPSGGKVSENANQATAEGILSEGTLTEIGTTSREVHLADNCFSPVQQSPIGIGPEASLTNSPIFNAYFENENNNTWGDDIAPKTPIKIMTNNNKFVIETPIKTLHDKCVTQKPIQTKHDHNVVMPTPIQNMHDNNVVTQTSTEAMQKNISATKMSIESMQDIFVPQTNNKFLIETPFETTSDDEFLNSIIANQDSLIYEESEERINDFNKSATESELLRRVYCKRSLPNAKVISELDGDIIKTSTMCDEYPNSDGYHASKRFKSSYNVVHGDTCLLSSNHEASHEENESIFQDDFLGVETSSCDSAPNKPLEMNCIEISSSPSPWRWQIQYPKDQTTTYDGNH